MKILNFTKAFSILAGVSLFFAGCDKRESIDPIGDRGQTVVKIIDGGQPGEKAFAIDFVNKPITLVALEIRRDVPNNAELNKPLTVTIQDDSAAVTAAGYTQLSPSFFTISGNGVTKVGGQGGTYTVTFAPGEFSKLIYVTVPNATLLDPSTLYGLGFRIISSTQGVVTKDNTLVVSIGAKNQYDGRYSLTFQNYHPSSNPGYTGTTLEVELRTSSGNCVKIYALGGFFNPSILGGVLNAFSFQEPEYCIDPVTNKVTVQNTAPGATTFYTMNPNYDSHYDPATKMLYAKFGYSYVNGNFALGTSREWTQVFTYLGPR